MTYARTKPRRVARVQWILAAVGAAMGAQTVTADEIAMKGSARLATGAGAVRLGDIAELTGPEAERLADIVVGQVRDGTSAIEISVREIRAALTDAGVHWGKVNLNGSTVIVRPTSAVGSAPPMFMTPASIDQAQRRPHRITREGFVSVDTMIDLQTVQGAVTRTIMAALRMAPQDVRLTFSELDQSLLKMDLNTNRFEIQPLSNLDSDRVKLSVRVWSHGRIVHQQSISVHLMIRMGVVVLRHDMLRGDVMQDVDCTVERRWVTPIQASTLCDLVEAVGRVTSMPLKAGTLLKKKHVKREVLVKRGDRVIVRCLVGGVVISLEANARSDAAEGESVELRKLGERNTFMATVTGPGAAIVDLSRGSV